MRATGYAVWLMPPGKLYSDLQQTITCLSQRFCTPVFQPHVTLLAGIAGREPELIAAASELAGRLRPFEVQIQQAAASDDYFRCVFVDVYKDAAIEEANRQAALVFGKTQSSSFRPHLSLLYGNLPAVEREQIRAELGTAGTCFPVDRLYLFLTEGVPAEWRQIGEYGFSR